MKNHSYITPSLDHSVYFISFARPFRVRKKDAERIVRFRFERSMSRHFTKHITIFDVQRIDERNFRVICLAI